MTKMEELDAEAEHLRRIAAPASAFEALRKRGWTTPSQREGNGIPPCPPDCGVCHPELMYQNGRRQKRR